MEMAGQALAQAPEGGFLHGGIEHQVGFLRLDARKATAFGQELQFHHLQQRLHRRRQGPVAIHPIRGQLQQRLLASAIGRGPVGGHFFVGFGDPIGGDEGGHRQIHLGVVHRGDVLASNLRQLLLEHLHVEIKADGFHLAALFHPQQVAHPTDLHVAHGQLVTTAQLGKFLNCP